MEVVMASVAVRGNSSAATEAMQVAKRTESRPSQAGCPRAMVG
jgi:hypothetical protein